MGRFVVANEDIRPHETILVEEAFCSVLYPDKVGTNCSHCLERFKVAFGCKWCINVVYCSIKCRDEAQNTYHQWECKFQDVFNGLGLSSVARLAFRMIASRPLLFFLERQSQMDQENGPKDDKYLQILTLVGLEDLRWPEDLLARSTMALVLLGILKASGYFGQDFNPDKYSADEMFIGSLILKHIQVRGCVIEFGKYSAKGPLEIRCISFFIFTSMMH